MIKIDTIMANAWAAYRSITAADPACKGRGQFGLCLRAAWEQAQAAAAARREWAAMDGDAQYAALTRMAWAVKRRAEAAGRGVDVDWIVTSDDARTVAGDAWIRVTAALERNEASDDPKPLGYIMYAACAQAAHSIARAEVRHVTACTSADAIQAANADVNGGQSVIDLFSSCTAAPIGGDIGDAYAIRAAIAAAAATDATARKVITLLADGYTVRDIAGHVSMSKSAVQRRIDKIRATIMEQLQA